MSVEKLKTTIRLLLLSCLLLAIAFPAYAGPDQSLEIEKSAAQTNVVPGDLINYTIEPRLKKGNKALDVVISDPIPAATSFVSATGGGVYDAQSNSVTWTFPEFNQGGKPSFELIVRVDNPTGAAEVVNTATISGNGKDGDPIPGDNDSVTVLIQSAPSVVLSKTPSADFAAPGAEVTFTIGYQNTGNADAINAVLTDTLPPFTNYVDSTLGGVYNPGTNTVTWPPDTLTSGTGGDLLLILEIDAAAPNGTLVQNTATMTGDNFTAVNATGSVTVQSAPLLSLVKTADSPVAAPDENITYNLEFSNEGNAEATGVILEDIIPLDTFFVSATGGGQFDGTKVVWNLLDLEASQTGSVSLTVHVRGSISPSDDIQITNTATLSSSNADPASAELEIPVVLQAILELSKTSSSDFVDAGRSVFYTLHYENTGSASAENVVLSDRIPAGTSFASATGGGQLVDGEVIWTDPGLVPGAVGQVQLELMLDESLAGGSDIINTASIESDTTLPVSASSTITVNIAPSLHIEKLANVQFIQPGEEITYALQYKNRGNADAFTVSLEDRLPQNTTFVSASGGGIVTADKVTWLFPKLGIGQTGSVTLTVLVDAVDDGTIIHNSVTLDSVDAPAVSANSDVTVRLDALINLIKHANVEFVTPGQEQTYTISYENAGNASAINVVLEDFLPTSTSFVTASAGGIYDALENKVVWNDPELSGGAFGQVQLTLKVDEATADDTVITNSVTATSDNTSPKTASDTFIVKSSPDLRLIKTADVENAHRGSQITYTLTFNNAGNATSTGTVLQDLIPDNTSFVSASGGGLLIDNAVTWFLSDLPVGEEGSVNLTVLVSDTALDGSIINNVATLDSGNAFAVSATNQVIVNLLPSLSLSKTSSDDFVEAGQQVTFTLAYENSGNAAANGIRLTDAVPGGTTFVSATGGGTLVDGIVVWTEPSLSAGAVGQVQLTLKVNDDAADDLTILNNATLNSLETSPVTAAASITVKRTPILKILNTASVELADPGDEVTFTLDYINIGNATATGLVLENSIPANTAFVSATGGGTLIGGVVTWTSTELAIGIPASVALTVRVDNATPDGTVIVDTATLDASNSYAVTDNATVVVQTRPILTLTKTANESFVEAGAKTTFTIAFENIGSEEAVNLILEDQIPDNSVFVSASGGGIHDPVLNKVSWNFASMQVGENAQVTMTIEVDIGLQDGTVIQNSATLDSEQTQPVSASDSVIVRRTPELILSKDSNVEFIGPGETLTYTIDYSNIGNTSSFGVVLEDPIPANTSYVASTGGGVFADGVVTWNIAELPVAEPGSVSLSVLVDPTVIVDDINTLSDGTIIKNVATMDSPDAYAVSAENEVVVKFLPKLELTKTADREFATPGDTVTYVLDINNTGNVTATNLVLEDTLPDKTTFVSASDGGTEANGIVTWSLPSLTAGESGSVSLVALVDSPLDNGTTIHNSSSLYSDQTTPVSAENTLNVQSAPLLSVSKTADKTVVNPGEQITYTLTVNNTGNANASDGVLKDTLPANTTFVSASNGGTFSAGVITWSMPILQVGAPQLVTLAVMVNSPLDNNTRIYNTVTLDSAETTPVSTDHSLYVQSAPVLIITKGVDKPLASPGGQLVYTIQYTNSGNANASNTLIQDLLPANTSFVSASGGVTPVDGVIKWNVGTVNAGGGSGSVTMTVLVDTPLDNGTVIFNIASLQSDETAPVTHGVKAIVNSAPLLTLDKTADKEVVEPGEQIVYTIAYGNNGNANATGVTLLDRIPANTQFVSASDGGTESGGIVSWPINTINAGTNGSVTLTVKVDSLLDNATPLFNLVSLDSSQTQPVTENALVIVQSAPDITLVKTASTSLAQPEDLITYTLSYGNSGNANASNGVLTDAIPTNTSFISATGGGTLSAGVVTWLTPTILAGSSSSVTLTVQVVKPLPDGTVISNLASLVTDQTTAVDSSVDVTIESSAVLTLDKTASAAVVQPEDLLTYTFNITNSGNANATNAVLTDIVPANTTFVSATGGGTSNGTVAGSVVTWNATELPVGVPASVTMTVMLDPVVANGTDITNNASLSSDGTPAVTDSVTVSVQSAPILLLTKNADHTVVNPGDLITYTLEIANSGNANATTVILTDTIPARTTFVSATGGGTESAGVVTWNAAELPVGIPASVTMMVMVDTPLDNGSSIINNATLDSAETIPLDVTHTLNVQSAPVLSLDKTADKTIVKPGDQITYTLALGNNGNANATTVILEDTIPDHTSFISASGTYTESAGVVTWMTPELQAGNSGSVTLTVLVDATLVSGTPIYNSATLDSDQTAPVSADHTLSVQSAPVLTLTKTADKTVVNPEDQITYTLSLGNSGNANATVVILEDTIPDHTSFVSASGNYSEAAGVVTWTTPELLAGSNGSVTLTVLVDPAPLVNGTPIYNSATLDSDETAPVSADHTLAVQSAPVLTLVKTADKTVVNPSEQLTYTLTLGNTGNANATVIKLEDTIPDHTSFVSASSGGTEAGGVVTWTTPQLLVGIEGSVTLTVLVDTPLDNGTTIYNSATLDSDETEPVSASHQLNVQSAPVLTLLKTADKTVVKPDEQITYTLSLGNTGNANATNVILADTLPQYTTFVSATGGGTETNGIITWPPFGLPAGGEGSVTMTVMVDPPPLVDGTPITNSATLDSDETEAVTASHQLNVQSAPVLTLVKTADKTVVKPGEQITYTLAFGNDGNANATTIELTDTLPQYTSFVSATGGGTEVSGIVTWNLADLLAGTNGSVSVTVLTDNPLDDGTLIYNSASIDSDQTTSVGTDHSLAIQSAPVLTLTKTADRTVAKPGDSITYTINFANIGNANATNAVLTDTIPANTLFVSASDGGLEMDGVVTWPQTTLNTGDDGSLSLVVQVLTPLDNGTVIYNSVTLSNDQTAAVSADHTLYIQSAPLLSVSKTADKTVVIPGDQITYTLTVENTGNANASDGILQDTVPANTTFVSASNGGTLSAGVVTWSMPIIQVGAPQMVTLTIQVNNSLDNNTLIYNTVTLDSAGTTPVSTDHSLYVQSAPILTLTKSVDKSVVSPTDQLVYTLTYSNTGNANAGNTLIQDLLPANTTFVSASGGVTPVDGVIKWNVGTVNTGADGNVTLTVLVDSVLDDGTVIYNIAGLQSDQTTSVTSDISSTVTSAPLLTLDKTADKEVVEPGEQIVYTLNYANKGNANATGVSLRDRLPANTSFVSASDGGTESGGIVSWPVTTINAGSNGSVTLTVKVDSPLDNATPLFNLVSLDSSQTQPVTGNALVIVQSAPDITLVKTASTSLAQPDDLITYTLTYGNSGNANASNGVLTDTIPTNTTFVSATGGGTSDGTGAGSVVTWLNPLILAGSTNAVTLTVRVVSSLPNGTVISNLASLVTDQTTAVNSSADVTIESSAILTLDKTASASVVQPEDLLTYTFNITNSGNANATNVVLTDVVPTHTTFVSATGGGTSSGNAAGSVVTWNAAGLPVGVPASVTMTVMLDPVVTDGTDITNNAKLSSDGTPVITDSVTVDVQSAPVLLLTKNSDRSMVIPGDMITYTLEIANSGNANATTVVLTDTVPDRTTFVSATGGGIESAGVVTWMAAELAVGVPASVTMTVVVDSPLDNGTSIINTASLDSAETDILDVKHTLNVQSAPVLSLDKTADKTVVNPGDQITYTLSLGNSGNANATTVKLEDTIPDHTSFVSASGTYTESGGVVTWTAAELQAGNSGSVTLTVLVESVLDDGTPIYNSATLDSAETAPVSADHTLSVQSAPVLTLAKTADKTVVNPEDHITYTLSLGNSGNANATTVILEDTIPDHTSFVSASGNYSEAGGVVTWTTPELLAGSNGSVTLTVLVDPPPLVNGTPIYNSATLDSDETAPVSADHTLAVQSAPVLTLIKTADSTVVNPGDQLTYTLALGNTGNANATVVKLEDTIPDHTSFVSASSGGTEAGGVVTWTTPQLLVGSEGSVTLTVLVNSPLDNGTTIYNSATLDSDESEPVSASHNLSVQSAPILTLVKTADKTVVKPDEQITYTLALGNTGNANAINAVLADTLPQYTSFVSATGGGTETGGIVTWPSFDLPAGGGGSVTMTVMVDPPPLVDGTPITNSATLGSDQTEAVSASHQLNVQSAPVLTLVKTADKTVTKPDEQITYTLAFSNDGNANASTVVLTDALPANTTFVSATGGGMENGGIVTWMAGELLAGSNGSVALTVKVVSPLDDGTTIYNSATLESDQTSPVSDDHSLAVQSAPALILLKTADTMVVSPGDQVTYTLRVENNGNANASNAVLEDSIPANTVFVSATGDGIEAGGIVTWTQSSMLVGIPYEVTLTVKVNNPLDNGTTILNSASLTSDQTTPVSANHSLNVQSAPVLSLAKSADKTVAQPDDYIVYTLSYDNSGNANAANAVLQDLLPDHTNFISATDGGMETLGVISWPAFNLNAGDSGTVSFTVQVVSSLDDGTLISNSATISSDQSPPVAAEHTLSIQSAPKLSLDKQADSTVAKPGDLVEFTLTYANNGNADAKGVVLTDFLPNHTRFVSASNGGLEAGGVVTWLLEDINAGENGSVTLTVAVDTPLDNGTPLFNIASLESNQTAPVTDGSLVIVQSAPVMTLVKSASVAFAKPGDLITYTLTYGNSGNANATNAILTDAIPPNTTYVSETGGGAFSNGVVTWTSPIILAGSTHSVTMTVRVDEPLSNGTVISNLASLVTDRTATIVSIADVTITSSALLSLEKTADASVVQPGDLLTYTFSILNSGNANATNVELTDIIPTNTTFVSATGGGMEAGGVVTWSAPVLSVGVPASVTLTVLLDPIVPNGTIINNNASLTSDLTGIITDMVSVSVQSTPVLSLVKTADRTVVNPGDLLTYTLSVENTGNANASGVLLTDAVPARTTFVSATGGATEAGGVVTWSAAELPVGIPASVTMTVWVDSPLENGTGIVNNATLASNETESISVSHTLNVQSTAILSLEKTAGKTVVKPGETITYTLKMINTGNANTTDTVLQDTLPPNTTFVSASNGGTPLGGVLTWGIGDLSVGIPASVTLTVLVDSPLDNGTFITNNATLSAKETAPVSTSHRLSVQSAPILSLEKTADKTVAIPGDQITYTLALGNSGNANATIVTLEDTIPNRTTFVSASGNYTKAGGVVTWTAPELLAGSFGSVTLTVKVDTPLDHGTMISNSATLGSSESTSVSASHSLPVQSAPVLSLVKTADKTVVQPGDLLTYTLNFGNSGNSNATAIRLEDTIPDNTSFVSASAGGVETGGVVTWTAAQLLVGTQGSVHLTVAVISPLDNGTTIYNNATLNSNESVPVSANHSLTVQSSPVLELLKTADTSVVNPGDHITYMLELSNTGNANASGVELTDTLPQFTTFVSATGGGTEANGVVSWNAPTLPVGTDASVTLTVVTDQSLPNATLIYNSATLVSQQTTPVVADHQLTVQSAPILTLTKTADKTMVSPGDTITYTISFENKGNASATGVTLSDVVPINTSFVSATGGGSESSGLVTWMLGTIGAGSSGSVSLTVLSASPLDDGTIINNNVIIESDQTVALSADHSLAVQSAPVLTLEKIANKTIARPGELITYVLNFRNIGDANASDVKLRDHLPANTSFVSASGAGTESGGVVSWPGFSLQVGTSGSVIVIVSVNHPLPNATLLHNVAELNAEDQAAPISAFANVVVQSAPAPELTKTADVSFVQKDEQITYTIDYANRGTTSLKNAELIDLLPAGTSFVSASNGGVYNGDQVTWSLGSLNAGSSGKVTLVLRVGNSVVDGDIISNVAFLKGTNASTVAAVASTPVLGAANIHISKTSNVEAVLTGDQIIYTINYSNSGNATATGLTLEDGIPQHTSFVSASDGGQLNNGVITWNPADLAPGENRSVSLTVEVGPDTVIDTIITNTATLNSHATPPVSASVTVVVHDPLGGIAVLGIDLTPDERLINAGEEVQYTADYRTITSMDASKLEVIAFLPANVIFVSASDSGVYQSNGEGHWIHWDMGDLAGHSSGQVLYRVRHVNSSPAVAQNFSNASQLQQTVLAAPGNTASFEEIRGLVSVSASNALPATSDFAEATVRVQTDSAQPIEIIPVTMLSRIGLSLLILLAGLMGGFWIIPRPVVANDKQGS